MKRLLSIALLLAAVAPASACDFFGMFRCRPARTCTPTYTVPVHPSTRVVYSVTPYSTPVIATAPSLPPVYIPASGTIITTCPNGRCPNVK